MKLALAGFILILVIGAALAIGKGGAHLVPSTAPLPGTLEIARTPEARAMGLSGRATLPDDFGLLFVFPEDDRYGFWMKDMLIPIDIVWIASDGRIVGVRSDVAPDTYPEAFFPPEPIRYVLEMRAGEAARRGYAPGGLLPMPE